jgi:hypothetical protein
VYESHRLTLQFHESDEVTSLCCRHGTKH